MRKVLIMIAVVIAVLSSCGTKDIEQEATEQLKATMRETVFRPDDATLINVHTTYKTDSLCILEFTLNAKNGFDLEVSIPMEYVFAKCIINGEMAKYDTWTQFKPVLSSDFEMDDEQKEVAKALAKEGFDYSFLLHNKVADIKEKYREQLMQLMPDIKKDSNIEDRLMYAAAMLRFTASSNKVPTQKGKDIKL